MKAHYINQVGVQSQVGNKTAFCECGAMKKKIFKDKFLTQISKKNCYTISSNLSKRVINKLEKPFFINYKRKKKIKKKFLKLNAKSLYLSHQSSILTFKKKIKFLNEEINDCRLAKMVDKNKIVNICKEKTSLSRFTKDLEFKSSLKKGLRETWVKNFFIGKRGSKLFVFSKKKKFAGFILVIEKNLNVIIDLIVVSKKFQIKE